MPSPLALTHAIAVERDRVRVYLAALTEGGQAFRFDHLPVGKYDLLLVARNGTVFEGLALGGDGSQLSTAQQANVENRIAVADTFFKQHTLHRLGVTDPAAGDGDAVVLALVERYRTDDVLKQSGEKLNQLVRRLEIVELHQATDDWELVATRHLYREGEPATSHPQFFKDLTVPGLGNLRVIDSAKDLGTLPLPNP